MPPELDEHILSTLTPEEVAAIKEEPSAEEVAAIAAIANGAEDGPDDDDDEDDGTETAAATTEPAAAAAKDTPPEPDTAPAPEPEPETAEFRPRYEAKLPDDFATQEAAIKEQADALVAKFKGGDIDFDQYQVEAAALAKSERALDEIRLKASLSQEMTAQTAEQQWAFTVRRFMSATAKAEGGIDYVKDAEKNADLDLFVKALARDEKNSDKPAEWFLSEAHRRVQAMHGIATKPTPAPTLEKPAASRKPPIDAAPKTLAQVPGGDGPGDDDGNEFAAVDRLTGDAQEEAIRRMTPSQRERYMSV
jgi:hypothetical protein